MKRFCGEDGCDLVGGGGVPKLFLFFDPSVNE